MSDEGGSARLVPTRRGLILRTPRPPSKFEVELEKLEHKNEELKRMVADARITFSRLSARGLIWDNGMFMASYHRVDQLCKEKVDALRKKFEKVE